MSGQGEARTRGSDPVERGNENLFFNIDGESGKLMSPLKRTQILHNLNIFKFTEFYTSFTTILEP